MPHRKILETPAASAVLKIEPTLCRLRILWQMTKISFLFIRVENLCATPSVAHFICCF